MSNYKEIEITSPAFRVTFANVAEVNDFDPLKPCYDIRALFSKTMDMAWYTDKLVEVATINGLVDAAGVICNNEYPVLGDGDAANCFSTPEPGQAAEQYDGHLNHWYLKLRSGNGKAPAPTPANPTPTGAPIPFGIVDVNEQPVEAGDVYNGMWMRAIFKLFPFNHPKFGLKIISRCEHLQVLGHDEPFRGGGSMSAAKKFAGAAPIVGLPAGVGMTPTAAPQVAPTLAPTLAPTAANPTPGLAPQAMPTPGLAPQATPAPTLAPGEYAAAVSAPTAPVAAVEPTLTPKAGAFTLQQWLDTGQTLDELRANGIII